MESPSLSYLNYSTTSKVFRFELFKFKHYKEWCEKEKSGEIDGDDEDMNVWRRILSKSMDWIKISRSYTFDT